MRLTYYHIEVDETDKQTSIKELQRILKDHGISVITVELGNSIGLEPRPPAPGSEEKSEDDCGVLHDYVLNDNLGNYNTLEKLHKKLMKLRRKHGLNDEPGGGSMTQNESADI